MDNKGLSQNGSLLLLVVSNLLLYQDVVSTPICPSRDHNCLKPLDLFSQAVRLSHNAYRHSREMFLKFNKQYAQGKGYYINATNSCHNSGLSILEEKEQVEQTHVHPEVKTNKIYPDFVWSESPCLQIDNEDTHHSAFILFHCLWRDSHQIDIYTKLLVCQVYNKKC
uniref:Uncharacterized protein n=1 Tax=Bos mutus grunniens TaxID=30521 RepID=A0A8B9YQF1_BOSMU